MKTLQVSSQVLSLSNKLRFTIEKNLRHPPKLACSGMPLHNLPIDHIAIALETAKDLRRNWKVLTDAGANTIEAVHLWPDGIPGCPPVAEADKKWMATIDIGELMIVLLAPHSADDLIARFLHRAGTRDVHHIAFATRNIRQILADCLAISGIRQITSLAVDEPYLSQVFLGTEGDIRITELVERGQDFRGTFTCRNIAALTTGEREDQNAIRNNDRT